MALGLTGKKEIVAQVNEAAKGALSAVVADSRGVEANQIRSAPFPCERVSFFSYEKPS